MNRTQLQQLSDERIEDAQTLLANKRWPAAYYLAGYSLECALKSCVLAYIERTGIIFQERKFSEKCWTHDIETLFKQADLFDRAKAEWDNNKTFAANWGIVKDWSELKRYELSITQHQAENLFRAITDFPDGVLTWIKNYW